MKGIGAVVVLLLIISCATSREEVARQTLRQLDIASESWGAYTACGTKPTSWIKDNWIDSQWLPGIRAHERVHREIAAAFPSCEAFLEWNRVPLHRLGNEAAAFCVQAAVDLRLGLWPSPQEAVQHYAELLAGEVYSFTIDSSSAAALIELSCELPSVVEVNQL